MGATQWKITHLPIPGRQLGLDQHVYVGKVDGYLWAKELMAAWRRGRILHHCHEQEEEHPGLGPELAETPGVGVQGIVLDPHQQCSDDAEGHQCEQREHLAILLQCPATHGPGVPKSQRLQTGVPATEVLQNRASPTAA